MAVSTCLLYIIVALIYSCSAVIFEKNVNCPNGSRPECSEPYNPVIFQGSNDVGMNTVHVLFSSFGSVSVSVLQMDKGVAPIVNWEMMFNKNYSNAVTYPDGKNPENSFTLELRRLIEFVDVADSGKLNEQDLIISHWLNKPETYNTSMDGNKATLIIPLPQIDGVLTIDVIYHGASMRDLKFPKLRSSPKGFFFNIELKANRINSTKSRFALELLNNGYNKDLQKLSSSRYIDDQYTPGIFSYYQLIVGPHVYPAHMLFKPAVYQSSDRAIEQNTLMQVYDLHKMSLDKMYDRGMIEALYKADYSWAFNVSLGRAKDGFFTKTNYSFTQFEAGLDMPELDSTKKFVTLALAIGLALPAFVGILALIVVLQRRYSRRPPGSAYDAIRD